MFPLKCQARFICRRVFFALMAQFDVHRNIGKHKDIIPYVVVFQSSLFAGYRRRVVVPLVRKSAIGKISHATFNPSFKIKGVTVILHPLEMASIPNEQLGDFVESLSNEGRQIIAALGELLTQAWK
jgi:toxin CcdB